MRYLPSLRIASFIGISRLVLVIFGMGAISAFSLYSVYICGLESNLRKAEDMVFLLHNVLEEPFSKFQQEAITITSFEQTVENNLNQWPDVQYNVFNPDGTPLMTLPSSKVITGNFISTPEFQKALHSNIGSSIRVDSRGEKSIFVASTLNVGNKTNAVIVVSLPFHQRMAYTYQMMRWVSVISLIIAALILAEAIFSSRYITYPLARLNKVAEQISQGNLNARATLEGPSEVANLSKTINNMASRLQSSLNTLHAFVGNASHELRTPLTAMKLHVGALCAGALDEPEVAQRFLSQIDCEIDRLVHMVNDMLDLSQIETGNGHPGNQVVNLYELASEVQAFWDVRSKQNGLNLELHSEPKLPGVKGDPFRLRQLFDNLLDNAIKNTAPGGGIKIALYHCPYPDVVRIEVHDTGIGITPEHIPHIFERFYRIDKQSQNNGCVGGGLGLAIARSIVISHGGEIGVNSLPGSGSTFWIELPAASS